MNYCNKCGNQVSNDSIFCPKCGNKLDNQNINNDVVIEPSVNEKEDNKKNIILGICIGLSLVLVFFLGFLIYKNFQTKFYFNSKSSNNVNSGNSEITTITTTKALGKYQTVIIYDNEYDGVKITNNETAYKLISKDSTTQKNKCPKEILEIENNIINNYGITAVNLCEMDVDFATELGNVFKKIYDEYPGAGGYLTNLSLANVSMFNEYIAAFYPTFTFAKSNTDSTYPRVYKMQILLNSSYFLNKERLSNSVTQGSNSGHFPPNSTIYSPLAHELGHYLSFIAMLKKYNMKSTLIINNSDIDKFYSLTTDFSNGDFSLDLLKEAYNNYQKDTNTSLNFDDWRGTISAYALAKDNNQNYIYDETIAESFHDVYLNGDNARDASKYIITVLKQRLNG